MSRGNSPSDHLSALFGVDVTDPRALRRIFGREATGRHKNWHRGRAIYIPRPLYDKYIRLYDLSLSLSKALDRVLDDAEHRLVMEEAQELGYDLPNFERFHKRLQIYRTFLQQESNPREATVSPGGNHMRLSAEIADTLQKLTDYNCHMVGEIFAGCFNTEYMKHFGYLRRSGFHYAGPAALQETLNVLGAMIAIRNEIVRDLGPDNPAPPRP